MKRIRLFETMLYASILLVALCMPLLMENFRYGGWGEVLKRWLRLSPLVLIFLINNYVLVPRMLFQRKHLSYFLSCIVSVVAVICLSYLIFPLQPPFAGVVHRSYIVNLDKINLIERNRIVFEKDIYIPVGEQYKEEFQNWVEKNFLQ